MAATAKVMSLTYYSISLIRAFLKHYTVLATNNPRNKGPMGLSHLRPSKILFSYHKLALAPFEGHKFKI